MKITKPFTLSNRKAFGLALQALVFLSVNPKVYPSNVIAEQLRSEATVIRRILAKLALDNLLEVREGRDGGYRLKQPPEAVTLAAIYQSLQTDISVCESMLESTGEHAWGVQIHGAFSGMADEINQSVLQILQKYTLADIAAKMNGEQKN